MLRLWLDASRWVYNKTVEILKGDDAPKANFKKVAPMVLPLLPERFATVPYQVKRIAVRDACKAMSQVKMRNKIAAGTDESHELHFRSRKNPIQSCYIPKSAVTRHGVYYTILGKLSLSESLPDEHKDCRLTFNRGRWYLVVPSARAQQVAETQGRVVALDPGIRTFQTYYSETEAGHLGRGSFGRLMRLAHHLDDLTSRTKKEPVRRRRQRMRKAQARLRWKVSDLVSELHHQVANYLVKNFDVILLPTFSTSDMVVRGARKLRSKSVRSLLTLRHYEFKQFLRVKAWEYGKVLLEVNEAYTTRTSSWTGEVKASVGREVTSEGVTVDRDINAARGIFLRALGDTPILRDALAADHIVNVCE